MPGECNITVGTFDPFSATSTPDHRRVATDIEKQDDLSPVIQCLIHSLKQRATDRRPFADGGIISRIDDDHWWQGEVLDPLGE